MKDEGNPDLVERTTEFALRVVRMFVVPFIIQPSTFILFSTMTDIASHPPQSPRFRRDRPVLERRAGAWLRDFTLAAAEPGFTIPIHLEKLAKPAQTP